MMEQPDRCGGVFVHFEGGVRIEGIDAPFDTCDQIGESV